MNYIAYILAPQSFSFAELESRFFESLWVSINERMDNLAFSKKNSITASTLLIKFKIEELKDNKNNKIIIIIIDPIVKIVKENLFLLNFTTYCQIDRINK